MRASATGGIAVREQTFRIFFENSHLNKCLLGRDVSRVFCEFLEVAVHQILFVRGVYPPEMFERKRSASLLGCCLALRLCLLCGCADCAFCFV